MKREWTTALVALFIAPVALAAQDPTARIEAAQRRAAAAGVPTTLLESRVAEGRAKGVSMDRIAAVVERRAALLVDARNAMARAASRLSAADLNAGADALEAGIDGGSLRTVIEQARAEDRPVAIAVLTYLHKEQGVPVDRALERVTAALKKGPEELRNLPSPGSDAGRGQGSVNRGQGSVNRGQGNAAARAAKGRGGPPEGIPAPGKGPGAGKPAGVGKGNGKGKGKG